MAREVKDDQVYRSAKSQQSNSPPTEAPQRLPALSTRDGAMGKKINGNLFYFGPWGVRRNGQFVRIPGDGWKEAEALYEQQRADLYAGREPQETSGDGCTLRELCNSFLTSKRNKLESGELSGDTFADYHRSCARLYPAWF